MDKIVYIKEDEVGTLSINRPEKYNALNKEVRLNLKALLNDIENDNKLRVLIIRGNGGKSFISGSDINELKNFNSLEMHNFIISLGQELYTRIHKLRIPVIAEIDGYCLGAGLELALACDLRIASEKSKFGLPEISLGIIPGGGGTQRLTKLVGVGLAKEMIYLGEIITSEKALNEGLINRVFESTKLHEEVLKIAYSLKEKSASAVEWAKRAINMSEEVGTSIGLCYEALVESVIFSTEDKNEGMAAFIQKREAKFVGR